MRSTRNSYLLLLLIFVVNLYSCSSETVRLQPHANQPTTNAGLLRKSPQLLKKDSVIVKPELNTGIEEKKIQIQVQTPAPTTNTFKDILPILTLLLGILIKELLDGINNRKKTYKIGKRWKAELQNLPEPLTKQIQEIKDSVKHRKENHNESPRLTSMAALSCENFDSLDKAELLNFINRYYINNYANAVSLAGKINLTISIIKSHNESLKERYSTGMELEGKRHDVFNANFQELIRSIHVYKDELVNSEGKDALYGPKFKPLDDLYGQQVEPHSEDGKFDYLILKEKYFIPMIKELEKLSADVRTKEMITFTRKCLDNVAGLKMESGYSIQNLENHIGYFEEDLSAIKSILTEVDDKKRKFRIF